MWARVVEMMLGLWLLASPFVFRHPPDATARWALDLAAGVTVVATALGSFHRALPRLHLLHLATALVLLGTGWVAGGENPAAAHRNWIVLSLVLGMLALVPSRALQPPEAWRRFRGEEEGPRSA